MGKIKNFLGMLAVGGVALLAYDMGNVYRRNEERSIMFSEALELQEPPIGFLGAYMHQWESRLYPELAQQNMEWKKELALIQKLQKIGPGDEDKLDELVYIVKNVPSNIRVDAINTIARVGGARAKATLYFILVDDMTTPPTDVYGDVANTATEELYRIDPGMTVTAIIAGQSRFDRHMDILTESGDERSLRYLMKKGYTDGLYKFLQRNAEKDYIAEYKGPLIRIFEKGLRAGIDSVFYFCDEWYLENYGVMIRRIDPGYARARVIPRMMLSCNNKISQQRLDEIAGKIY